MQSSAAVGGNSVLCQLLTRLQQALFDVGHGRHWPNACAQCHESLLCVGLAGSQPGRSLLLYMVDSKQRCHAVSEQECIQASTALLVTGEDPESEDGRRLLQVVEALHRVSDAWTRM